MAFHRKYFKIYLKSFNGSVERVKKKHSEGGKLRRQRNTHYLYHLKHNIQMNEITRRTYMEKRQSQNLSSAQDR